MTTDINCDMGEGVGNDEQLMPFISSVNIACGKHAGDTTTMRETILLAQKQGVKIGAHPSFDDKKNFGRAEMNLPETELYNLVFSQMEELQNICQSVGAQLHHVKPHGALYNLSAHDARTAALIARAVKNFNSDLILFGLSGSHSISEAKLIGLKTASEVFADRTYQDDGSLTSRKEVNALIESDTQALTQVLEMIEYGILTTVTNKKIKLQADTVCIHGDGAHAVTFAKKIFESFKAKGIEIKSV